MMKSLVVAMLLAFAVSVHASGNQPAPTSSKAEADAAAVAAASASAAQKQAQGQVQLQGQVGIVKSQNDNAANAVGGKASVVVQGDNVQAPDLSKTVPSMAYTTGNTTAHCIVAVGGSVAVAGFGGAVTGGVVDEFCKRTWLIQYAEGHGYQGVKQALLCGEPMYAAADPSCKAEKAYGGVGAQSFEAFRAFGGIGG